MRVSRFFAGAAAALLLSGCDYWRNLTGSKTVTKVPLIITALDAWDSLPIAGAFCSEPDRNLSFRMDVQGNAFLAEAPTGNYLLSCLADGYHKREMEFEVGGKGAAVSVPFARLGLTAWYPEEPEKRPRILRPGPLDTIRYPSKFDLPAFPGDSSGNFRFEWTFARNPGLNRGPGSIFSSLPYYRMDVDPSEVSDGPDLITLKVRSRLAGVGGDTGYVVSIDSLPIVWIRNKLPRITLDPSDLSFKLGCKEPEEIFSLTFKNAKDPDGSCDSVVFHTRDTSQALGRVHEIRSCTDPNRVFLPLRNPFHGPTDILLTLENTLDVSVWDDNGEHSDTTIHFTTFANVLPTIRAGTTAQTEYFTNSKVSVWLESKDPDGTVEYLKIDWDDGDVPKNITLKISPTDSVRDTIQHVYKDSGSYAITAFVMDECNDTVSTKLREIRVRHNTAPSIQIQPLPTLPSDSAYSIRLTIHDKDVEEGMDRYKRIRIDWGDGQWYLDSTIIGDPYPYRGRLLSHYYEGLPPSGMSYKATVEVTDGQDGTAIDSVLIPARARP